MQTASFCNAVPDHSHSSGHREQHCRILRYLIVECRVKSSLADRCISAVMLGQPILGGLDDLSASWKISDASHDDLSGTSEQASWGMPCTIVLSIYCNNSSWISSMAGRHSHGHPSTIPRRDAPRNACMQVCVSEEDKHHLYLSCDVRCGVLPRRFPDILAAHHRHLSPAASKLRITAHAQVPSLA